MYKIIISPYSRMMRNGKPNPKNYPYFEEVVKGLKEKDCHVTQIGIEGEAEISGVNERLVRKSLKGLEKLIKECDSWIAVDNFFPHLCHLQRKPGVVIFGQSNPKIFGHPENTNLLKDKKYLREKQFDIWEATTYIEESFIDASTVINSVLKGVCHG